MGYTNPVSKYRESVNLVSLLWTLAICPQEYTLCDQNQIFFYFDESCKCCV